MRGILIFLVVFGHTLERTAGWGSGSVRFVLILIYAFHMPAFIFFNGMFAHSGHILRRCAGLLVTSIIFQLLYLGFTSAIGLTPDPWWWPYWVLWYLVALIWWTLFTPLILKRPKISLVLSIILGLLAGLIPIDGNWFAYQRALMFLPFYVVGVGWGKHLFRQAQKIPKIVGLVFLILFLIFCVAAFKVMPDPHWLFGNWNYTQLGVDWWTGVTGRAAVWVVSALGIAAAFVMFPRSSRLLEKWGRRSLPIFLLHVFVVTVLMAIVQAHGWQLGDGIRTIFVDFVFAVCVTFVTSLRVFSVGLSHLLHLK
jgi:fucose 4-O-acetylase-like acetyltransferase